MNKTQNPMARKEGLVIQEMPDELLVYDLETNKAHCLNQTASKVWKACDGKSSVKEIANLFDGKNEDLIWLAIDQLQENDLLEKEHQLDMQGKSRRELIKKVGLASVLALPVVASLTAPSSVLAAASCNCTTPANCAGTNCPSSTNCDNAPGGTSLCQPNTVPITGPRSGKKY